MERAIFDDIKIILIDVQPKQNIPEGPQEARAQ